MPELHVFSDSVFAPRVVQAFRRWFPEAVLRTQRFWVVAEGAPRHALPAGDRELPSVRYLRPRQLPLRLLFVRPGTRLVVHGLFGAWLMLALCLRPDLVRRARWFIWGGDLEPVSGTGWKPRVVERLRRRLIPRFAALCGTLPEDHATAVSRYGASTRWQQVSYPGLFDAETLAEARAMAAPVTAVRRVIVGNSATDSNRHDLLLASLDPERVPADVKFVLPLSYGDASYRDAVIASWQARLGARSEFLLHHMPLPEYNRLLASMDAGVYNFGRQQGLGNILVLLALARRVYLPEDSPNGRFLSSLGLAFRDIAAFPGDLGAVVAPEERAMLERNATRCGEVFGDEACRRGWAAIIGFPRREFG